MQFDKNQCNEYFPIKRLELLKNQSPMFQNQFNVMLSKEAAKDGSLGWVIGIANVPIYGIFGDTFYPPTEKWAAFDTNNNPPPKLSILQTTINNEEARITNVDVGFYNDEEEDGGMISYDVFTLYTHIHCSSLSLRSGTTQEFRVVLVKREIFSR